jgi:hypothetical protein
MRKEVVVREGATSLRLPLCGEREFLRRRE